jgi:hypothetical protein
MRLLPLMLLVVCFSASADWKKIKEMDETSFYVDFDTVVRQGNIRQFWSLRNSSVADKDGVLSLRMFEEHDCKGRRFRFLDITAHSELWAGGRILYNFSNIDDPWTRIPPDTVAADKHKVICAK